VADFARELVTGTVENVEQIDRLIARHAEHWRLDRMAIVDRNLLRMATQEFLYDKETPKTVVINEAIEIARRFSAQESPQFINGILDSIKKELER
jgi:N utilization substance protein B